MKHVLNHTQVFHVGTLNPSYQGANSGKYSLEGFHLSVSHCPLSWTYIAKLGGQETFLLERDDTKGFLDALSAMDDPEFMKKMKDWGVENGYVSEAEFIRAWSTGEDGEFIYYIFSKDTDKEDILHEIDLSGDGELEAPDGHDPIEVFLSVLGNNRLVEVTGIPVSKNTDSVTALLIAYAEKELDLDGVWYSEDFNPVILSSPRGVIFRATSREWTVSHTWDVNEDFCFDDEDMIEEFMANPDYKYEPASKQTPKM